MSKFHINPETGDPGVCTAEVKCPFGDLEADHYPSPEIARVTYEIRMKHAELKDLKKKQNVLNRANGKPEVEEITSQQRQSIVERGVFETENTTFQKVDLPTDSMGTNWIGKTNGTASDVYITVNVTQQGTRSYISIDNELSLLSQNPAVRGVRAAPEDLGQEMKRAIAVAKEKKSEEFSAKRTVREAELNYDEGVMTIGSASFSRGEIPGSPSEIWTQRTKNGEAGYQVRINDNTAILEEYRGGKLIPVYKKELYRGVDTFKDGAEAARFMLAAEPRLKSYEQDLSQNSR